MLFRGIAALAVMAGLMQLVWLQIVAAHYDGFLTVEQLMARVNKRGALSFDRHYAMVIDFCIFPALVALIIFFCAGQWTIKAGLAIGVVSVAIVIFCIYVLWIEGNEVHVHDGKPTLAGYLHGAYAAIVIWAVLMLLVNTARPDPMLLLITCIVIPAFFFVGTHMFLGMINSEGAASTFLSDPLRDPVGWSILIGATALTWVRTYFLIPQSFWANLN